MICAQPPQNATVHRSASIAAHQLTLHVTQRRSICAEGKGSGASDQLPVRGSPWRNLPHSYVHHLIPRSEGNSIHPEMCMKGHEYSTTTHAHHKTVSCRTGVTKYSVFCLQLLRQTKSWKGRVLQNNKTKPSLIHIYIQHSSPIDRGSKCMTSLFLDKHGFSRSSVIFLEPYPSHIMYVRREGKR